MKLRFTLALFGAAILAACGSGGGNGGSVNPVGVPATNPPPATTSLHVKFVGGDALQSPQSMLRRTMTVLHPLDTSTLTQLPITVSVPAPPQTYFANDHGQSQGTAIVQISPQPSTAPTTTFSDPSTDVVVNPLPSPSPSPGATPAPPMATIASVTQNQSATNLTVTVSGSVSGSLVVPEYNVGRVGLVCNANLIIGSDNQVHQSDTWGGVNFVNGVAQQATSFNPGADLYIDGSWCTGAGFANAADSSVTLHAPYGAIFQSSTATPFVNLKASQWSNSITSETLTTLVANATTALSPQDELLVKTADGHIVKIALNGVAPGTPPSNGVSSSPASINVSFEESGFSVDGF